MQKPGCLTEDQSQRDWLILPVCQSIYSSIWPLTCFVPQIAHPKPYLAFIDFCLVWHQGCFYWFLNLLNLFLRIHLCMCQLPRMCTTCVQYSRRPEEGVRFPGTRDTEVMSCLMWIIGMEARVSARASAFLSAWAISPNPGSF